MDRPPTPELTARSVVVGTVVGVLLAAGNVYVGSKTGIIDSGGVTATLIGLGILGATGRALGATLEANIVQTIASSAGCMAITTGVIGPIGAMVLAGKQLSLAGVAVWGAAVACLGTVLALPLRRLYLEVKPLPFPSPRAAAEVIRVLAGDRAEARRRLALLAAAFAAAALVVVVRDVANLFPATTAVALAVAGVPVFTAGVSWSPLYVAGGVLLGPRMASGLLVGGLLARAVIGPLAVRAGYVPADLGATFGWLLWPGAALMIGGSLAGLALEWRAFAAAFRDLRLTRGATGLLALCAAAVLLAGWWVLGLHPAVSALAIALAVVLTVVSARATGETDATPAGQLGGLTQLVVSAVTRGGPTATLGAGGVVAGSAMHGASMMSAWKTGSLLGASPERQLAAQLLGVVVGAIAAAAAFAVVAHGGLGTPAMPAPAAQSWRLTAETLQGAALPAGTLGAALVALALGVVMTLAPRLAPLSPVAIGMGFLLPLDMIVPMVVGGLLLWLAQTRAPARVDSVVAPLAAGVLVGEGVVSLAVAVVRGLG